MAKFLIVEARFYDHLNDQLIAGAKAALKDAGLSAVVVFSEGAANHPGAMQFARLAAALQEKKASESAD